ncbi:MAG: sulfotransferase family protein [Alphaproteobacteria bacterium]|nr:MAG: sulfotransferase family protein [Alphaproteobacteria bacterium]
MTAGPLDHLLAEATKALKAGRTEDAARHAAAAVVADAGSHEALYLLAVAERYLGQGAKALETLARLKAVKPDYGRAYQEEGHIQRTAGRRADAVAAYEQAVILNPALAASWKMLATLYTELGDTAAVRNAGYHLARLSAMPPELVSVTSFLHEGRLYKAERLCRAFLQKHRHHVEAMRLLADIGLRLQVLDDAEFLLESCLEFEPGHTLARLDYVNVLHRRQKYAHARAEAAKLRDSEPGNAAFEVLYANECVATGDVDEALEIYARVAPTVADNAPIYLAQGHAFKTTGDTEGAVHAYRAAYGAEPGCGDAYWSLANLKTYRFTDAEMAAMGAAEADAGTRPTDRYHLNFALGKAYEDRGEAEAAFSHYARGNALKKAELRYSADAMDVELKMQAEVCTSSLFEGKAGMGYADPAPIFIVGLPRAGSTLLEQILASHSMVDGTLELPNILATAHRLNGRRRVGEAPRYPGILHDLSAEQLAKLGETYIDETRIYRQGAPFFTDKMPNNFKHIGLIKLILPNAKIIDARRNAMDCCWSGFKQLFAEGQEFSYGLEDIARYYRGYVGLMDHWDRVLPGQVLRVQYEHVVADTETQVRRLLDFCGLPFEDACVAFHKTERQVRTASAEQVRQPINRKGVGQWHMFEPWLQPLRDTLGPLAD